jgi:hypothetical protein
MGYHPYGIFLIGWDLSIHEDHQLKDFMKEITYQKWDKTETTPQKEFDEDGLYGICESIDNTKSKLCLDISDYFEEGLFGFDLKVFFPTWKEYQDYIASVEFPTEDVLFDIPKLIEAFGSPKIIYEQSMS